ncbi:MAG: helix-turn-helix transcriptional regulator [Clostridiales bacterium]|nr:helix-turn-helix transcriptional regulator [Clostridiales bacterium]
MVKTELSAKYIEENNLSRTKFCQICKISTTTLKKIMNNDGIFRITALFKIARVLNVYIHELFK